jgi:hypothetical protein
VRDRIRIGKKGMDIRIARRIRANAFSVGVHTSGEKVLYSMMVIVWDLGKVYLGTEASLEFNTILLRD